MLTAAICISINKYKIADIKNLLHGFTNFKNYSFVKFPYLLIRFNRLNSSHGTHTKHSEKDLTGKGQLIFTLTLQCQLYNTAQMLQKKQLSTTKISFPGPIPNVMESTLIKEWEKIIAH